jgi:hypothetical protein
MPASSSNHDHAAPQPAVAMLEFDQEPVDGDRVGDVRRLRELVRGRGGRCGADDGNAASVAGRRDGTDPQAA